MLAAGADGCRRMGWICITRDQESRRIESARYEGADALIRQQPRPDALAIDVPIGLPRTGSRECDRLARQHLGPRRSSVFPAPIRPLLGAGSWEDACARRERIEGKWISKQVFGILERIGDIDAVLRALPPRSRRFVREVHPEVSFREWARRLMADSKKTAAGRAERRALVANRYGKRSFDEVRAQHRRKDVADDDILDAFAALWTAERILTGDAWAMPEEPHRDDEGLAMEIVV